MDPAGFVALAMAGLWIAYLVPHRLQYRQQLLDSCHEDRFSDRLRVVRVADARPVGPQTPAAPVGRIRLHAVARLDRGPAGHDHADRGEQHDLHHPAEQPEQHDQQQPGRRPGRQLGQQLASDGRTGHGGGLMERPHATRDRVTADAARRSAAEHAKRAAHLARRAAGARRRAALTAVLLLLAAAGWSAVGVVGAAVLAGVAPTVLLLGVLALGRRAVLSGARADDDWHAGAATRIPLPASSAGTGPRVVGRAVRPSDASTEVMARVAGASVQRRSAKAELEAVETARVAATATARSERAASAAAAEKAGTWAPVPVPRPAYTLKPSARRQEPAPLDLDGQQVLVAPEGAAGRAEKTAATLDASAPVATAQPAPFSSTTGGIDLDAILARRRASGE